MSIPSPLRIASLALRKYKSYKRRKNTEKRLGFDIKDRFYYPSNTLTSKRGRTYTVVSAVYGVEKYIDDMLASLLRQTLDFKKHIQVILVNDGSVDRSGEICEEWAARFPDNIKVIHKENGGVSSARNAGIPHAKGDWLTFIDPDDLVKEDYFYNVDTAISKSGKEENLHLVSCKEVFYYEDQDRLSDTHPLRYRFKYGERRVVFDDNCVDMQLAVGRSFFNRNELFRLNILFHDIRPNAEDLHFINNYFLLLESPEVLFVPTAIYWYRKRADNSSLLDDGWSKVERYGDLLEKGYIDLLNRAKQIKGYIPLWLQRTITYDLAWHIKRFTNNHRNSGLVPVEHRKKYIDNLKFIFSHIEPDVISSFELAGLYDDQRFVMLSLGHPALSSCSKFKIFAWDQENQLLGVRYHYTGHIPNIDVYIGRNHICPSYSKTRIHKLFDLHLAYSVDAWYSWDGCSLISVFVNGDPIELSMWQRSKDSVIGRLTPKKQNVKSLPIPVRAYRSISQSAIYRRRFKDAWLLMDRDTQADDNAEHLYRWIKENKPEINAWFVLRKTSHDWNRLKRDGFRLIAFDSIAHRMALLNSKHVISSHADHYIVNFLPRRFYRDLMRWNFTFLQHGVIKDDLSGWLNSKAIRNFITSAKDEYDSICIGESSYKFTCREVALTGLPRHDWLINNCEAKDETKTILIMPTWRQGLTGNTKGLGNDRFRNDGFTDSEFFRYWSSLLSSKRLHEMAERYGYELVFFPHANLEPYLQDFANEHVRVIGHSDIKSIQDLFISSSIMITDYSSVAFEMAYIERPVLYYQFDEDYVFGGGHLTQKGYFDYRRDGFGPVCVDQDTLLMELEKTLEANCQPAEPYAGRMKNFFAYRDGKCCERVFNVIAGKVDALDMVPDTLGTPRTKAA